MVAKLEKAEGDNKGLTKDINEMRAVINTSTNRESDNTDKAKTLEIIDLKNRMHLLEEENLQIFNEKALFKGEAEKAVQATHRLNEYIATLVVELKNSNSTKENTQLEQENRYFKSENEKLVRDNNKMENTYRTQVIELQKIVKQKEHRD